MKLLIIITMYIRNMSVIFFKRKLENDHMCLLSQINYPIRLEDLPWLERDFNN